MPVLFGINDLSFLGSAGAQTLVVLDLPGVGVLSLRLPALKLRQTEESLLIVSLGNLGGGKGGDSI